MNESVGDGGGTAQQLPMTATEPKSTPPPVGSNPLLGAVVAHEGTAVLADQNGPRVPGVAVPMAKPWEQTCNRCGKRIGFDRRARERGWCATCEVATWSADKQKSFGRLIGAALRGEHENLQTLLDDAVKHVKEPNID